MAPRERPETRTDCWTTPQELVDLVLQQFGSIDLDPCAHPESPATKAATLTFDIRRGENGLTATWPDKARVFCNPPYSRGAVKLWATKCAAHATAGGEVLLLINAGTAATYFRDTVFPNMAAACFLSPRVRFAKDGVAVPAGSLADSALIYFGANTARFAEVWSARGTVVTVLALQGAGKVRQLQTADDGAPIADRATALLRDLVETAKSRHTELFDRVAPLQAASQAARTEHGQYSLEVMEAERAVSLALQEAISAVREASRIEGAVQAFEAAMTPVSVPVAKPYQEREAARKAARNTAKVARVEMIMRHRDTQEAAQAQQEAA